MSTTETSSSLFLSRPIKEKRRSMYNPLIHHRRSIRLQGYDYSQAGLYFVTIVIQNRKNLFGNVKNGKMELNNAGQMVEKWYYELENKYHDIKCREMVAMPNHFHCIIQNVSVGADLRVCPNNITGEITNNITGEITNNITGEITNNITDKTSGNTSGEHTNNITGEISGNITGEHTGSPLHRVIQWFKTMTTNEYIRGVKKMDWKPFDGKLWQRNYWEHIVRNENEYRRISQYIIDNPIKWENDQLNGGDGNIVMESIAEYGTESWMV